MAIPTVIEAPALLEPFFIILGAVLVSLQKKVGHVEKHMMGIIILRRRDTTGWHWNNQGGYLEME